MGQSIDNDFNELAEGDHRIISDAIIKLRPSRLGIRLPKRPSGTVPKTPLAQPMSSLRNGEAKGTNIAPHGQYTRSTEHEREMSETARSSQHTNGPSTRCCTSSAGPIQPTEALDLCSSRQRGCWTIPISTDLDESIVGRWDRLWIVEALTNLLSHAVKYGNMEEADCGAWFLGKRPRGCKSMQSGPGVCVANLERIFDRLRAYGPTNPRIAPWMTWFWTFGLPNVSPDHTGGQSRPKADSPTAPSLR